MGGFCPGREALCNAQRVEIPTAEEAMEKPIQIAHRGVTPSEAVSERVRAKAKKLERYFQRIVGCKVTLEGPGRHHRMGRNYRARIEITVPGGKLVVGRSPRKSQVHEDLNAAIDAAFREARRQLEDHARRHDQRAREYSHAEPARAKVAKFFPQDGYGFLLTPEGREIFFDEHSVLDGAFGRLRVGTPVRFAEEMGDKGPQASTVILARRERKSA
jgi:ribosomal subunit interface protein